LATFKYVVRHLHHWREIYERTAKLSKTKELEFKNNMRRVEKKAWVSGFPGVSPLLLIIPGKPMDRRLVKLGK